jgi:hypothetical protein
LEWDERLKKQRVHVMISLFDGSARQRGNQRRRSIPLAILSISSSAVPHADSTTASKFPSNLADTLSPIRSRDIPIATNIPHPGGDRNVATP